MSPEFEKDIGVSEPGSSEFKVNAFIEICSKRVIAGWASECPFCYPYLISLCNFIKLD
jgi:hypothetical protein